MVACSNSTRSSLEASNLQRQRLVRREQDMISRMTNLLKPRQIIERTINKELQLIPAIKDPMVAQLRVHRL